MELIDATVCRSVDEKGFVPDELRTAFFRKLRMRNENRTCFECNARNPTWVSLTYGVYLCLECSGEHRRKGVHISFVRSVELDRFTVEQLVLMAVGSNGKALEYFKTHGMGKTSDVGSAIEYGSKICQRFRHDLEREARSMCQKLGIMPSAGAPVLHRCSSDPEEVVRVKSPVAANSNQASLVLAPPTTHVVRRNTDPETPKAAHAVEKHTAPAAFGAALSAADVTSKPPSNRVFAAKQMAKACDFDFDFDELEKEAAARPPPLPPVPGSVSVAPRPAPKAVQAVVPCADALSKKKAISSEEYFASEATETAAEVIERESRFEMFAGAGAISSNAFFGQAEVPPPTVMEMGKQSLLSKIQDGADFFSTYLGRMQD